MTDCVLWRGRRGTDGYGVADIPGGRRYTTTTAHRWTWADSGRELLPGHTIHHLCENRLCVNLDHLAQVTHSEHRRLHQSGTKPTLTCPKCGGPRVRRGPTLRGYKCVSCTNAYKRARYAETKPSQG